jgi:hypothetical protein
LTIKSGPGLKLVGANLQTPTPNAVVFHRDSNADVVSGVEMSWKPADNLHALSHLLPAVWDDYGPGTVDAIEDAVGSYLAFTWQDSTTRVQLRLAFDERGPVLVARDTQPADKLPARLATAQKRDEQERQARLAAGKPNIRLPRSPGVVNDFSLEDLHLGQTRAAALAALPGSASSKWYRRADVPGGVSVVVMTTPPSTATVWVRQVMLRFDRSDRVREIRLRYEFGPAVPQKGESLLEQLQADPAGVGETIPARWAGLWDDLPEPGPTLSRRWRDDRTVQLYSEDTGGAEVVWLDRSGNAANLEAAPWRFVSGGVKGARLGDSRQAVRTALTAPAAKSGEADVHRLPASSPYEMVLVWYEGEKVSRLMAVHRDRPGRNEMDIQSALSQSWGRDLDSLGFIRRKLGRSGAILGAYFWNDDQVRVQTSVQASEQGQRVMTEWRHWPVAAGRKTVRR